MAKLPTQGIPGQEVALGKDIYTLAPITIEKYAELEPEFTRLYDADEAGLYKIQGVERFKLMAKFILESLRRNHPDVTEAQVLGELLDMGNKDSVFAIAMGVSGLVPLAGTTTAEAPTPPANGAIPAVSQASSTA